MPGLALVLLVNIVGRSAGLLPPLVTPGNKAYLLWSPGVVKKTAVAYVGLAVVKKTVGLAVVKKPVVAHPVVLGLLSSSCCLVQLVLNAASFGCAGFNTVLGPLRPLFLALTLHLYVPLRPVSAVALAIALSPELLALLQRQPRLQKNSDTITIALPTMGCVACVDAVSHAVRSVDGVESATVLLSDAGGQAIVPQSSDRLSDDLAEDIITACARAGFPGGSVVRRRLDPDDLPEATPPVPS